MSQLFGTDGIRGIANQDLTPEFCLRLGRAGGEFFKSRKGQILLGRDTRISGPMLEGALAAGLASVGVDVQLMGIVPTPAVALLVNKTEAAGGAVISASHNPVPDNGIKYFSPGGYKLTEEEEETIEKLLESDTLPRPTGTEIGDILPADQSLTTQYISELAHMCPLDLRGYKVVLDCAHGAMYQAAPAIFARLGADVIPIHQEPLGDSINVNCGSTNPENAAKKVIETGAHMGFCFDGDGDRVIALDEEGHQVNGDKIMAILAAYLNEQGRLKNHRLVVTVMSNLGLKLAMEERGIQIVETQVGDRNVLKAMEQESAVLGGEQSGHIIHLQDTTTGDGLLTALKVMEVLTSTKKSLNALAQIMRELPQVLVNVKVKDKNMAVQSESVWQAKEKAESELGAEGRILVRPSGTEPIIRVMVEGRDREKLHRVANNLTQVIKEAPDQ